MRAGERILEIGCGLALASLVGHRRGADITASDCHPLAAAFLKENLRLNDLAPMKYRHGDWAEPEAGSEGEGKATLSTALGRFDFIIGSDLLYERDDGGVLAAFIARHAEATAEVWIVDPDRGNRPAFNGHMAAAGFLLRQERLDRSASGEAEAYKGRILIYHRTLAAH